MEPLRVLIVEDEALVLMQLEMMVEDAGQVVVGTAMYSDEAVRLARATRPDLALVDLQLADGKFAGLVGAKGLREIEGVMIVFVTANGLLLGSDFAGAAGIINKPFTRAVIAHGLAYLEECVRHPPPVSALPSGMSMAAEFMPQIVESSRRSFKSR